MPASLDWKKIKLLVLDVDGTLTPGTMYYGPDGEALKRFHTHDAHGMSLLRKAGINVAVITGEDSPCTNARMRKLGISELHVGIADKTPVLEEICARSGIVLSQVAYAGDDLGDLPPMKAVVASGGIACAVANARPQIKDAANFLCSNEGGDGAVREVCDLILESLSIL